MKRLRLVALGAVLIAVGSVIYSWMTGLSDYDIAAHHKLKVPVPAGTYRPGEVVAVSRRGDVRSLCDFEDVEIDPDTLFRSVYYNQYRESLPDFADTVERFTSIFVGKEAGVAQPIDVEFPRYPKSFTGKRLDVRAGSTPGAFPGDCERDMAEAIAVGDRACTIESILVRTRTRVDGLVEVRTIAIGFRKHANYTVPERFAEYDLEFTRAAARANGASCEVDRLPRDTKLRQFLRAIDRV